MLSITDIDIQSSPADECATDVWLEAIDVLKAAVKGRAQLELQAIKARETAILALLNGDAPVEEPKPALPASRSIGIQTTRK